MITCIICRELKEGSDEHVIPDSMEGYYHIYTVCTACNSHLGQKTDVTLTDHAFIKFVRFLRGASGKSGNIPNPFVGTHSLARDAKTRIQLRVGKDGAFVPYVIPEIKKGGGFPDGFSILLDGTDQGEALKMAEKTCKRNGLDFSKYTHTQEVIRDKPQIKVSLEIDTAKYYLGLLKIAYEFATDSIPTYLNDATAFRIARILRNADADQILTDQLFVGNPFDPATFSPFRCLFGDVKDSNHRLILIATADGLFCFLKIYDTFFTCVKLSTDLQDLPQMAIIGINDLQKRTFKKFTLHEFFNAVFGPVEIRFQYHFLTEAEAQTFLKEQALDSFAWEQINGNTPFYDAAGNVRYHDVQEKLLQDHLHRQDLGDFEAKVITRTLLDEDLYIRILPSRRLVRIASVNTEQTRL